MRLKFLSKRKENRKLKLLVEQLEIELSESKLKLKSRQNLIDKQKVSFRLELDTLRIKKLELESEIEALKRDVEVEKKAYEKHRIIYEYKISKLEEQLDS